MLAHRSFRFCSAATGRPCGIMLFAAAGIIMPMGFAGDGIKPFIGIMFMAIGIAGAKPLALLAEAAVATSFPCM